MNNKPSTPSEGNLAKMAGKPTDNGAVNRSSECESDQKVGTGGFHG